MTARPYTFVTVGYEGEAGLLRLQARSLRLYCPPELVDAIILVDNCQQSASNQWRAGLEDQYGELAGKVRFVSAAQLAAPMPGTDGWFTQQVLKIQVAQVVQSPRYVVLDSKNHLFRQLQRAFLETDAGLPRLNGYPFTQIPSMQKCLERTLTYLGLDAAPYVNWFTRTSPPFTMLTYEARELVKHLEEREGQPFASTFLEKKLCEFFLYSGFLESKGILHTSYDFTQPYCVEIWGHKADEASCAEAVAQLKRTACPFMAVHRRAIANMDERGRTILAKCWHAYGLFPSVADAMRFLAAPNSAHQDHNGRIASWSMKNVIWRFGRWKSLCRVALSQKGVMDALKASLRRLRPTRRA